MTDLQLMHVSMGLMGAWLVCVLFRIIAFRSGATAFLFILSGLASSASWVVGWEPGWSPFFICVNTVVSLLWVPGLRRPFFGESETPEVVSDDDES